MYTAQYRFWLLHNIITGVKNGSCSPVPKVKRTENLFHGGYALKFCLESNTYTYRIDYISGCLEVWWSCEDL